jgi:hypothetical protein
VKYWAFISYSSRDQASAEWLHKALESYAVPKGIAVPEGVQLPASRRLQPVFRDRDDLSSGARLHQQLIAALSESRFLIVVCSPHAAGSAYVDREIREFLRLGSRDRVLCVVVDGEPNISPSPSAIDREAFPATLRFEALDGGEWGEKLGDVPLAADPRPSQDGKTRSIQKVIAGMLGVGLDDLVQRERVRRRRERMKLAAAGFVAAGVAALAYVAMADRDYPIPGGAHVRTVLDRNAVSWFRPIPERHTILEIARRQRNVLADRTLVDYHPGDLYWGRINAPDSEPETWTTAQILAGLSRRPERTREHRRVVMETFPLLFSTKYLNQFENHLAGWVHKKVARPQGEITAWMLIALGQALAAPDPDPAEAQRLRAYARQALTFLERHRGAGGWAMYPSPKDYRNDSTYMSVLVLQALLHLEEAEVYVADDPTVHRTLLQSTAQSRRERIDRPLAQSKRCHGGDKPNRPLGV